MLGECQAVLSVCPPHGALGLAEVVAGSGFAGLYIDANAVAPETALAISARVAAAGATFVDAGIIGPPAARAGTTRFYLSGAAAESAAALFAGSLLEPIVCGVQPGAASAVKMCYAAYTKGASTFPGWVQPSPRRVCPMASIVRPASCMTGWRNSRTCPGRSGCPP